MSKYPDKKASELIKAFAVCESEKEVAALLRDVFTQREIDEAANRLYIAMLLHTSDLSYLQIAEKANTSTTTVTRVADWLRNKPYQGYSRILSRLHPKIGS